MNVNFLKLRPPPASNQDLQANSMSESLTWTGIVGMQRNVL